MASSPSSDHRLKLNPVTTSEWQLYLVLKKANLLSYYDTFISQGGDDVTQLIEARGDEFLEIMTLVGMAQKPLHVRRLQKSLLEYQQAMQQSQQISRQTRHQSPTGFSPLHLSALLAHQAAATSLTASQLNSGGGSGSRASISPTMGLLSLPGPSGMNVSTMSSQMTMSQAPSLMMGTVTAHPQVSGQVITPRAPSVGSSSAVSDQQLWQSADGESVDGMSTVSPILTEQQLKRIEEVASHACLTTEKSFTIKMVQNKKRISKELLDVINMSPDDPTRLPRYREYGAIYGRFDTKRKPDKALTLHEVSVNEAAAQICLRIPELLTRRDELFPLARQVVRDAGYQYAKGHARPMNEEAIGPSMRRGDHGSQSGSSPSDSDIGGWSNEGNVDDFQVRKEQQGELQARLNVVVKHREEAERLANQSKMDCRLNQLADYEQQICELRDHEQALITELETARLEAESSPTESSQDATNNTEQDTKATIMVNIHTDDREEGKTTVKTEPMSSINNTDPKTNAQFAISCSPVAESTSSGESQTTPPPLVAMAQDQQQQQMLDTTPRLCPVMDNHVLTSMAALAQQLNPAAAFMGDLSGVTAAPQRPRHLFYPAPSGMPANPLPITGYTIPPHGTNERYLLSTSPYGFNDGTGGSSAKRVRVDTPTASQLSGFDLNASPTQRTL